MAIGQIDRAVSRRGCSRRLFAPGAGGIDTS